ncbi:2-amino-4-hydroxy-6-hydroxymethyldihydropteridine diphosphokinase [Nitrincola schmidtii]|uniref:2-amino-4-hydroxy-6- hydroxymethyldihydropteridine diphosphokinase n=1 Tax=Nitrincola schmidtii TaxID=1730894 RepID=UPI00124EFAB3|nr:2-amino-4-hydroxy-6-hydroxymethyldihydropteridine diphosphokinase [Nitrincola schmidtii]
MTEAISKDSTQAVRCFIGLGSNLNDPIKQVQSALIELAEHPYITLIGQSRLYRSEPVGPEGQPDYINAVAEIYTQLEPLPLLDALQQIENAHQRLRLQHWGPRTLDLDLLLYGEITLNTERLIVPHPFITERNFVLRPLADLDSELSLPDGQKIINCLANCPMGTLAQLPL